jgi:hypothetical protein
MPFQFMAVTHDWIATHPVFTMFALFFASGLISLYSREIKGFLHFWPIRTLRAANLNINTKRLYLLDSLHNNPYNLLIYLALEVTSYIESMFYWSLIVLMWNLIFYHHIPSWNFLPAILGTGIGKATQVSFVLKQLWNYDNETDQLRKAIASDQVKLALRRPPSIQAPEV